MGLCANISLHTNTARRLVTTFVSIVYVYIGSMLGKHFLVELHCLTRFWIQRAWEERFPIHQIFSNHRVRYPSTTHCSGYDKFSNLFRTVFSWHVSFYPDGMRWLFLQTLHALLKLFPINSSENKSLLILLSWIYWCLSFLQLLICGVTWDSRPNYDNAIKMLVHFSSSHLSD